MKYVLLALPILTVAVGGVVAGSSWAAFLVTVLAESPYAAAVLVAAYGLGRWLVKRADVLAEVTAIGLGLGVISLAVLLLGLAGVLSQVVGFALLAVGIVLAVGHGYVHRERLQKRLDVRAKSHWVLLIPAVPLGIALAAATVYPGLLWPEMSWGIEPAGYDVAGYHMQLPREWHDAGRITEPTHNVYGYFPLAVEMHGLLAMHLRGGAYEGMYLAKLMHFAFMALMPLAVYGAVPGSRLQKAVAGVLAACVPWTVLLGGVAYNEGGLMLYTALALGWLLRSRTTREWAVVGGLIGLACGVKYTAVPMLLLAVPLAAVVFRRAKLGGVVAVLVGLAVFSPWLIRNVAWTGNPVFPQALGLFGVGHFSDLQVDRWQMAHSAAADMNAFGELVRQVVVDVRYGFVLPIVALVAGCTAALFRKAVRVTEDQRRAAAISVGFLLFWGVFWLFATHLQSRFFTAAIPVAAILCVLPRWWVGGAVTAVCLVATLVSIPKHLTTYQPLIGVTNPEDVLQLVRGPVAEQVTAADALGRPVVLVGDGEAWFYPPRDVRYRTIFDVQSGDALDAYAGDAPDDALIVAIPGYLRTAGANYLEAPQAPGAWPALLVVERGAE
ncbi:MAG: hypothetical protein AAGD32_09095 [Planctomycetota bacterium]